jgi:hypothetical protein
VFALEDRQRDRGITVEKKALFIQSLTNAPKGKITFGTRHPDRETLRFATQVGQMLFEAGYPAESALNYPEDVTVQNEKASIILLCDNFTNAPAYTAPLHAAFESIGIGCCISPNFIGRQYSHGEAKGEPGKLLIMVVEKP